MKRSGSCVPSAQNNGRRGLWSNVLAGATEHRLSSSAPGCFFLTVSYKHSVLHAACWFQVVWDALDHLSSLSSCGFPTLWDDSILFCVVRKAEGELGLLFSVFRMWLCKVSGLRGWNWELLWSLVSVSEPLQSRSREATSSFHSFITNTNRVIFPRGSKSEHSMFDPNQHVGWDFDNLGMKYFNLPKSRSIFVSG